MTLNQEPAKLCACFFAVGTVSCIDIAVCVGFWFLLAWCLFFLCFLRFIVPCFSKETCTLSENIAWYLKKYYDITRLHILLRQLLCWVHLSEHKDFMVQISVSFKGSSYCTKPFMNPGFGTSGRTRRASRWGYRLAWSPTRQWPPTKNTLISMRWGIYSILIPENMKVRKFKKGNIWTGILHDVDKFFCVHAC